MSDKSYLDWPFFDVPQRKLAADLDAWAGANVAHLGHGTDVDALCRDLVAQQGMPDAGTESVPRKRPAPSVTFGALHLRALGPLRLHVSRSVLRPV